MNYSDIFRNLNINAHEARLYIASLELGMATARDISQKAGIQRTYFYDLSENLIKTGFLRQVKNGKKRFFIAIEPEKLLEIQNERMRRLEKFLPQLKALQNTKGEKPKIYYYEGKNGIHQVNDDTLNYKGEIVGFTTPRFINADDKKLSKQYIEKRIGLGNKVRVIGELSPEVLELKKKDPRELRETRVLPKDLYSSEIEIGVYGNKVFITDYKEEFGFIIEGSEIAKTLKMIFEIVWNSGKIIE